MPRAIRQNLWIYLTLIPPFALLLIFTLIPIVRSFLLSFQEWTIRESAWIGLGNFVRLLGDPGMATVWLALDERLGRRVAVKVLRHDLADDEAFVARFRREAQLSAGLPSHPHIVSSPCRSLRCTRRT